MYLLDKTSRLGVEESMLGGAQSSRGSLEASDVVVCREVHTLAVLSAIDLDLRGGAIGHCGGHCGWSVCADWISHGISD